MLLLQLLYLLQFDITAFVTFPPALPSTFPPIPTSTQPPISYFVFTHSPSPGFQVHISSNSAHSQPPAAFPGTYSLPCPWPFGPLCRRNPILGFSSLVLRFGTIGRLAAPLHASYRLSTPSPTALFQEVHQVEREVKGMNREPYDQCRDVDEIVEDVEVLE